MIPSLTPSALGRAAAAGDDLIPLQQRLLAAAQDADGAAPPTETPETGDAKPVDPPPFKWPDFQSDPVAVAFLAALRGLPPPATDSQEDKQRYADAVGKLLRDFKDPATGELAFTTLKQKNDMIQRTLEQIDKDSPLHTALLTSLVSNMGIGSMMTQWMQDAIMSGGVPKEMEDW
ncbi:hypothetical protein HNO92_001209 [Chromobacterium alkanivorans]|uniref:hypothetical protein n=1 Tax=Chromobacterium alkanivorans TaxID=1071719 RepID=UPI002168325B|nr:hypothetical protein [Chromobacterium alkanivorans]MCS3803549.1 hypothetical protein [Chromobacterium alkanivorans]MCS3817341.1 hypothetical protein [Chromobacterium alkanivorans]MCS3872915.1 hypothetical protein [Chromobacterium alkanivorans]